MEGVSPLKRVVGGWLGWVVRFQSLTLCHRRILERLIRHLWLILAALLIAVLLLGLLVTWYIEARQLSGVTRLRLWNNVLQMIRVSPLMGSGPGAF